MGNRWLALSQNGIRPRIHRPHSLLLLRSATATAKATALAPAPAAASTTAAAPAIAPVPVPAPAPALAPAPLPLPFPLVITTADLQLSSRIHVSVEPGTDGSSRMITPFYNTADKALDGLSSYADITLHYCKGTPHALSLLSPQPRRLV